MNNDDDVTRVHALWLLLRPVIEQKAREFEATPEQMALALTVGTPTLVMSASPDGEEAVRLGKAVVLFEHCCKICFERKGEQ